MPFFLVERKKAGATTFYVVGVRQAAVAADVFRDQELECAPGDVLRVSRLGDPIVGKLTSKRDWETEPHAPRSTC